MSKWSEPNKLKWQHGDYCKKCWAEFTTLTEQERKNLENRAMYFQRMNNKNRLYT